jgi:hypothetical protein
MQELMKEGLKKLMFDHDWLDTSVMGLTDENIDTNDYEEEINYDTED